MLELKLTTKLQVFVMDTSLVKDWVQTGTLFGFTLTIVCITPYVPGVEYVCDGEID